MIDVNEWLAFTTTCISNRNKTLDAIIKQKKKNLELFSVGIEEIEEMEEGSTEIERQRSKDDALKQAKYAPGRPPGRPVEKVGRSLGRPVCTTCTGLARSIARSTD